MPLARSRGGAAANNNNNTRSPPRAVTVMRPGLFFQREGPGSEPGNSLLCPDEAPRSLCAVS